MRPHGAGEGPPGPQSWLTRLAEREYSVTEATILLGAAFALSALLGAVRQILFNAEFGTGREASAFYAAARLPDTFYVLIAGGALSSAMIPVLIGVRGRKGEAAARELTNLVLTLIGSLFIVLVLIGIVFAPFFVRYILAPGFDEPTARLSTTLTRIMLLQPLFLAAGSVALAVLNSRNQFFLSALSIVSHNFTLIASILLVRQFPDLGIYAPTAGVVTGGLLQAAILIPGLRAGGARFRPAWNPRDRDLRAVIRLLIPNGLVVFSGYLGQIIDTAFASTAREPGALAAVQNAWMLSGLPIALVAGAVGQAVFPRLAGQAARMEWRRMRRTVALSVLAVVVLVLPSMGGIYVIGRDAIRILFERGEFTAADGDLTNRLLRVYAIALPAYVATEALSRGLIAMRDARTPLFTNIGQQICRAAIIAALLDSQGARAIPIAVVVTSAVETVVLASILGLRLTRRIAAHERGSGGTREEPTLYPEPPPGTV